MTDKQIMINGVDVSKCMFFNKNYKEDDVQIKNFCELQYISCKEFDCANCYFKKRKRKEQECEQLRNKLNSNIERMNEQNEKLHNENKELKSYIKEDLVPHTQIYIGLINRIKQQMKTILMVLNNGKYRPVKNSTKEQCYQVLGNIQELLKTNIIRFGEVDNE